MLHHESDPYVLGLKKVIKSEWSSQKEFAEGVTTTVNLSNILRGSGGTSHKMREALAKRAGLSVEDVIQRGKQAAIATSTESTQSGSLNTFGSVAEMSASEILNRVGEFNLNVTENLVNYTRSLTSAISTLTDERDKLLGLLHSSQATVNAIEDQIKVVDHNCIITFSNKAAISESQQMIGDVCTEKSIAEEVFKTSKTTKAIHTDNSGNMESLVASPIYGLNGSVEKVVILIRDIAYFHELLLEQGWQVIPPPE